jgi:hypothetical protein
MKCNLAIPLIAALGLTIAFAATPSAGAAVFKPGKTAFTVKASNFTATGLFIFTLDCTTSTISSTTPAAGASFSFTTAEIAFSGCTATVLSLSCAVFVTTGGGDWTTTVAGGALDPPTNNSWPLNLTMGSGAGIGALTISLDGCKKGCSVTVAQLKLVHTVGTPITWTNATMPTLNLNSFVPYTAVGCSMRGTVMGDADATGTYTLTTAPDINIS